MPHRRSALCAALAAALAAGCALSAPLHAAPTAKPGLTGMWLIDPKDFGKTDFDNPPPYAPGPLAAYRAEEKAVDAGKVLSDGSRLCRPPGMPGFMMNEFALEILESPNRITMVSEASPLARSIYLDKTRHQLDIEPMWNGHSIGRWDGDTLVIDTANLNAKANHIAFGGSGPTSGTTHIVERVRLADGGKTMVDEMVIDDPTLLTKSYRITKHFKRLPADAQLWENACEVNAPGWSERFQGDPEAKAAPAAR